ncbi:MAG: hypothetical protein WDO68_26790 [Gammaproteobacteria bacterium]
MSGSSSGNNLLNTATSCFHSHANGRRVALASYRAGGADLRGSIEAFADEINLLIEAAVLQNQRGQAWASLRYLEAQHVHSGAEVTP